MTSSYGDALRAAEPPPFIDHAPDQIGARMAAGVAGLILYEDADHLGCTVKMGDDHRTSVVDADRRSCDLPDLFVCDGSVFPTVGGFNLSLAIQAIALRAADFIEAPLVEGISRAVERATTASRLVLVGSVRPTARPSPSLAQVTTTISALCDPARIHTRPDCRHDSAAPLVRI